MINTKFLDKFIIQSHSNNLKTKDIYPSKIMGLNTKISFGMGTPTHIPWISVLGPGMLTSNGFFPVYLYYKKLNILILSYGVSETIKPNKIWSEEIVNSSIKISSYINKPFRYGDSYVFKTYVPTIVNNKVNYSDNGNLINHSVLSDHLMEIIGAYKSCLVKKSNNSFLSKQVKKTDNEKQNKKTFLGSFIGIFKPKRK